MNLSQSNFNLLSISALSIFPVFPFLSVFILSTAMLLRANLRPGSTYVLFFLISIYLGLVNTTKVPESDLLHYYESFSSIGHLSFLEYIFSYNKEPVFYITNYVLFYITNGNEHLYILILSFLAYFILFVTIYKYYQKLGYHPSVVVFAVIIAGFTPQIFSLSAHLVRQFLAASILMYFMVEKLFYGKTRVLVLVSAIFIHSTVIFFVPLVFFGYLRNKFKPKTIIVVASGIILLISLFNSIIEFILNKFGVSFLTYALDRAERGTTKALEPLSNMSFVFIGAMIIISIIVIYRNKKQSKDAPTRELVHFVNIFFLLSLFILANVRQVELSVRYFFYVYFFFPFILPLMLTRQNKLTILFQSFFLIFILGYFIYKLEYGVWKYAPLSTLLINPTFSLLGI